MRSALSFATELARQTGELLLQHFRSQDNNVRLKADHSIVTTADLNADAIIASAIQESYPQDSLLSEELRPALHETPSSKIWVIDPLDGTTNFSLGLHYWGTLIARLTDGYPELAVLHFPLLGETYTARHGAGAYLNGIRLQVRPPDPEVRTTVFACCSRTFREYTVGIRYKPRILGSASYSFCCVAKGVALLAFEARPKLWDIAAAWLLLQEAGGFIDSHNQDFPFPIQPGIDYSQRIFPTLAAATAELLVKGKTQIQPKSQS